MTRERQYHYYLIYLTNEYFRKEFLYGVDYDPDQTLYAYTDDKKILRVFKMQRNMRVFHIKKVVFDREGVNAIAKEYQTLMLHLERGKTQMKDGSIHPFSVAMTNYEYNCAFSAAQFEFHTEIYRECDTQQNLEFAPMMIPEIRINLYRLGYWYFFDQEYDSSMNDMEDKRPFDGPSIDILSSFIHIYKDLLKGGNK